MDVRCPSCAQLIARVREDGATEIRQRGKPLAVLRDGEVYCARCGVAVGVKTGAGEGKPASSIEFRALSGEAK